jgi:hypothetical protein
MEGRPFLRRKDREALRERWLRADSAFERMFAEATSSSPLHNARIGQLKFGEAMEGERRESNPQPPDPQSGALTD